MKEQVPEDLIDLINKATISVKLMTKIMQVTVEYLNRNMSAEVAMANITEIIEKGMIHGED